jgi:hypothetical protein
MSRVLHVLGWQLSSESLDIRLGRWLCYAAAPAVLIVTGLALTWVMRNGKWLQASYQETPLGEK